MALFTVLLCMTMTMAAEHGLLDLQRDDAQHNGTQRDPCQRHPSLMPIGTRAIDVEVRVWHRANEEEADASDGRKGQTQAQGLVLSLQAPPSFRVQLRSIHISVTLMRCNKRLLQRHLTFPKGVKYLNMCEQV